MMKTQILSIDLQMPLAQFEAQFQNQQDSWPESMSHEVKPAQTRNGKNVYTLTVKNGNGTGEVKLIAEQHDVSQDIIFKAMTMRKMSHGFYNLTYSDPDIVGTDEDPTVFMASALRELCRNNKGTIAYMDDAGPRLVCGGREQDGELGIIGEDGTVFSMRNAKDLGSGGDMDTEFHVKQPINEWLAEHFDVANAIKALPTINDKMNFIGKYLIQARNNDEIESEEFLDIFKQAGLFGFTDDLVKMIYKLVM